MKTISRFTAIAILGGCAAFAHAQNDYPNRLIKLIVPFAPGGASDAVARPVAKTMGNILGKPVVVENKPGAAGNIALEYAARSSADGYTLLLGNISTNAMSQTSYAHVLKINPLKDLMAVGMVGATPSVLVASTQFAPKNGAELIAYAKVNPGKINYWLPGVGSGPHFDMVRLEKAAGIQMTAVPYSGGAGPGLTALLAGQIDIGEMNLVSVAPHIRSGKLKALGVSTPQRASELPDVPTAAEAGLPEVLTTSWQGLFVPSATPKPIIQKLHAALAEALADPEIKQALTRAGTLITPSKSPDEAQSFVSSETARWARIIHESGVKPE